MKMPSVTEILSLMNVLHFLHLGTKFLIRMFVCMMKQMMKQMMEQMLKQMMKQTMKQMMKQLIEQIMICMGYFVFLFPNLVP